MLKKWLKCFSEILPEAGIRISRLSEVSSLRDTQIMRSRAKAQIQIPLTANSVSSYLGKQVTDTPKPWEHIYRSFWVHSHRSGPKDMFVHMYMCAWLHGQSSRFKIAMLLKRTLSSLCATVEYAQGWCGDCREPGTQNPSWGHHYLHSIFTGQRWLVIPADTVLVTVLLLW